MILGDNKLTHLHFPDHWIGLKRVFLQKLASRIKEASCRGLPFPPFRRLVEAKQCVLWPAESTGSTPSWESYGHARILFADERFRSCSRKSSGSRLAKQDFGRDMMRNWRVRMFLAVLGFALFAFLVWRVGWVQILDGIRRLGWGFAVLVALGGVIHLVRTWAWHFAFTRERPRFFEMLKIRLVGEAVSQLTFAGQVMGEVTRAVLLRAHIPAMQGVCAVLIDKGLFLFTGSLFILAGAAAGILRWGLPGEASGSGLVLGLFGIFVLGTFVVVHRSWHLLSGMVGLLARKGHFKEFWRSKIGPVAEVEDALLRFYHETPGAFYASFALNLVGHLLAAFEVFLVLTLIGVECSLFEAVVVEAFTKVLNAGGLIVPGNVGAYEGGNMLILRFLGESGADGLTLGLARRLRGLTWAAVGLSFLYHQGSERVEQDC